MKKLGQRNYELIADSMKTCGFATPWDGMMNEEQMYVNEFDEILDFLTWLHKIDRPFGRANYEERWSEFKSGQAPPESWFQVEVHFPGVKDEKYPNMWLMSEHSHIKRISGDHKNKLQIAARLCSNLSDPDFIQVTEVNGTYNQKYEVTEMAQFVKENQKEINKIRMVGYEILPSEFY